MRHMSPLPHDHRPTDTPGRSETREMSEVWHAVGKFDGFNLEWVFDLYDRPREP